MAILFLTFNEILEANSAVGVLLLRMVAGILFFFQGYDKLINLKIDKVVRTFDESLCKIPIPHFAIKPLITLSSLIEFSGGFLLFIGLFKSYALYFLTADIIFVAFIFSAIKPMWDMQYYFPRLILIVLLLFTHMSFDKYSLDALLGLY